MISSQVSQLSFVGNASTSTPYALTDLRFDDSSWLTVEEIDADGVVTTLALGTDFTITGSGTSSSASIVTGGGAVPATSTLRVSRNAPRIQSSNLVATSSVPSAVLEQRLDWMVMALIDEKRRQEGALGRTLRLPDGKTVAEITAALAGGKYVGVDEDGAIVFHTAAAILAASGGVPDGTGIPAGGETGDLLVKQSDTAGDAAWGTNGQLAVLKNGKTVVANPSRLLRFWIRAQELSVAHPEGKYLTVLATTDSIGSGSGPLPALCAIWAQRWGVGALLSKSFETWDAVGASFTSASGSTPTTGTVTAYGMDVGGNFTYLPNGRFWRLASGATVTQSPRETMRRCGWRKVRCFYGKKTGGGTLTFDLKLDGATVSGGTKAVNTSTGSGTNGIGYVDFEAADGLTRNGALSLVVTGSVADADYLGCIVYLESGIVPILFGLGGGTLPSQGAVPAANWSAFAAAADPALVFFALKGGTVTNVEDRFDLMATQIPLVSVLALGNFESVIESTDDGQDSLMREVIRRKALEYGHAYVDEWDFLESYQTIVDHGLDGGDLTHFGQSIWKLRAAWLDHHLLQVSPAANFLNPEKAALDRVVTTRRPSGRPWRAAARHSPPSIRTAPTGRLDDEPPLAPPPAEEAPTTTLHDDRLIPPPDSAGRALR